MPQVIPPPDLSTVPTGQDGEIPIWEPNARWTHWRLSEIYTGAIGLNRYIPKVEDWVVDTDTAKIYRVSAIDPTTGFSTLVPIKVVSVEELTDMDILMGVGPGTQSDTYRVYIDKSTTPYTMSVDARLTIAGTQSINARIFKGSVLNGTGEVVSAMYDQLGNLLTNVIPLQLVSMPNSQNYSVKAIPNCYTTHDLRDGELVTAVFYAADGHVVSKRQLLVENTAFIRATELGTKYVQGISLRTPFLSQSDPKLIQYPLNVPINGLNMMGVVHYSDGSELALPIDGTKFKVMGFEPYVATITGQHFPVVLRYNLSPGEFVYGSTNVGQGQFITESYQATTLAIDGSFSNKLYGYPVWIDGINGYRMEWYLYSLERAAALRVTPHVRFNTNTPAFSPLQYGVKQTLSVSINLHDVNGSFASFIHTQTLDVTLFGPGTLRTTNWLVGYAPNQNPQYGVDLFARSEMVNQNLWKLRVDANIDTLEHWLQQVYFRTLPLVDTAKETQAPTPNFFKIVIGNQSTEFPISHWNIEHQFAYEIANNSTVYIQFFKRLADNDIQLGVSGLPVYQSDTL